ncbi:MAG: nuclear transport factor 2 family protein [Proteobacteria bacterium]|nr:nuclear transport factor 2 family protein [Pseudomonadota bacterium]
MGVTENKKIVRSFYEAGNRGDFDACFDLISDDITWTNIGSTCLSGTYRGKAELMEKLLGPLFGQLKAGISSSIDNLIGEADTVVALTSGTAETKDGRPYNNKYCQVIRIRDGKFVEVTEYFDTELTSSVFGSASSAA